MGGVEPVVKAKKQRVCSSCLQPHPCHSVFCPFLDEC